MTGTWACWHQVDKAQEGTGDNHAISALKFKIIQEFLELGWNALLSDVDIIVVQVKLAKPPGIRAIHCVFITFCRYL